MRSSMLFLLLPLAAAAPMAAQTFEGTVTYKLAGSEMGGQGADMTAKSLIKGDMSAMLMTTNAGPMGPMEIRMITDGKTGISTMLIPMMAGMGGAMAAMNGGVEPKGLKLVINPAQMAGPAADKVAVKKLGTSQTIAGVSCTDYEATSEKGTPTRFCLATGMGAFAMPSGGGMMGGRRGGAASAPAWVQALNGGFPLKVWSADGKVLMEVTSITKGSVSPSEFAVPDGYMDMSKMGGMMGGRGGGL